LTICQQNEISSLSSENTFDADDWIVQAKQLHADIERSRVTARDIVAQHEHTKPLEAKVEDASAKVGLIETEIAFNQAVAETLEEVQRLCQQLDSGRTALANGQITTAIDQLEVTDTAIGGDTFFTNTNVMSILSLEVSRLRQEIEEALRLRWSEQLKVDQEKGEFRIIKKEGADSLETTIAALSRLDILMSASDQFHKDLISTILDPIVLPRKDGSSYAVAVTEAGVSIDSKPSKATVADTLSRIRELLNYLRQNLPSSIMDALSLALIPAIASKMISGWLSSAIPTDLIGLDDFEVTLDQVLQFTKTIESWGWSGQEELVSWVNQAPRLWLTRRRVDSLDSVRKVLAASKGTTKQVERVEIEKVSRADGALLDHATNDDWDAGWDEEKEETAAEQIKNAQPEDDDDLDAWGLDDDAQEEAKPDAPTPTADEDADDAWGWGDDDEEDKGGKPQLSQPVAISMPTNGASTKHSASPREVTLREVYTVTDVPDSILQIIQQQIADSKDISQPP
jgi:centromere/kinetochore protein ZW10